MNTIVYTAILGGSDTLKQAPIGADRCVCFTDRGYVDAGWELVKHRFRGDPRREAWKLRALAHQMFPKADRTVWVDASFTVHDLPLLLQHAGAHPISGLRHHERNNPYWESKRLVRNGQASKDESDAQIAAYQKSLFQPTHLTVSCILVRDRSAKVRDFNERWWHETQTWSGDNTQVSIDYAAWKAGLTIHALKGDRHRNPYATHDHADHKMRRKPYRLLEATA